MGFSKRVTLFQVARLGTSGFRIPYSIDFSALEDGPLPAEWQGGNWEISSGVAIGTPTLEENDIVNGDFAAWTGDNPDGWTVPAEDGSNYVTENPAGQAQFVGAKSIRQDIIEEKKYYHYEFEVTARAGGYMRLQPNWGSVLIEATSTGVHFIDIYSGAGGPTFVLQSEAAGDITIDDVKAQVITDAICMLPSSQENVTITAEVNPLTNSRCGIIARANSRTNPTDYIFVLVMGGAGVYKLFLGKCVDGVFAAVETANAGGSDGQLQVVLNGTNVKVYYKTFLQYDVTIDEESINGNKYHGMISLNGGNSLDSFFLAEATPFTSVFIGGSNTEGTLGTYHWPFLLLPSIAELVNHEWLNKAHGGTSSWYALIKLQAEVIDNAPDVVFLEYAVNDATLFNGGDRANKWAPCAEALIRRLRTALPNAILVAPNLIQQEDYLHGPAYISSRDMWLALCAKYDVATYRIDEWLQGVIGSETPTQEECEVYGDEVHFTNAGHDEITNMLIPHLADWYPPVDPVWSGDLGDYDPPYFADVADFEEDPIIVNGADLTQDGTGWSVVGGTAIESSTVDDTLEYSGTFSCFGLETPYDGGFTIGWKIDGGSETQLELTAPGITQVSNFARDAHTVTLRVISGTVRINKFLAI